MLANAAMSARNFWSSPKGGIPPSQYVDLTRIDVARYLIEGSRLTIDTIAVKSGFRSSAPRDAPRISCPYRSDSH